MSRMSIAFVFSIIANLGLCVGLFIQASHVKQSREKARRLELYCEGVRDALRVDIQDLGNARSRDLAARRFLTEVTFHSSFEVSMCTNGTVDLTRCAAHADYKCLAELAEDAAAHIER